MPETLTPRELHNITGLDPEPYWLVVEDIATKTNIETFVDMSVAIIVLLFRYTCVLCVSKKLCT